MFDMSGGMQLSPYREPAGDSQTFLVHRQSDRDADAERCQHQRQHGDQRSVFHDRILRLMIGRRASRPDGSAATSVIALLVSQASGLAVFRNLELGRSHLSRLDASWSPGTTRRTVAVSGGEAWALIDAIFCAVALQTALSFGSVRTTEGTRQGHAQQHPQKLGAPSR
jgi:hypothetical protein